MLNIKCPQLSKPEKKPWRNQSQSGASSPLANEPTVYDYDSGCITSN